MPARPLWKGSISFGLLQIPIALYGTKAAKELRFNLLDKRDHSPIGYERVNKSTGKKVAWGDVVKGYEYEPEAYVIVTEDDFRKANPEASQTVDILDFVDANEIDPMFFENPYYVAPTDKSHKSYAVLREVLKTTRKAAICRFVLRTREYIAAIFARDTALVLNTLRYAHEIRPASELDLPGDDLRKLKITSKELAMAQRLVTEMVSPWDAEKYHDQYYDQLRKFIERKAKQGHTKAARPGIKKAHPPGNVIDMMSVLKRSVELRANTQQRPKRPKRVAR